MQRSLLNARCALTAPFHPYLLEEAVFFLWHCPSDGLEAAAPGRYPAHRSVEFGLSSPRVALSGQGRRKQRGQRPPGPNAIESIITPIGYSPIGHGLFPTLFTHCRRG